MNDSELRLSEAVLLGTAFLQATCRNNGIPALFIKGPAATMLGVRPSNPSSDIDILVCKEDAEVLVDLLRLKGWIIRGEGWEEFYSSHSITMLHNQWPCDVDIHYRFPGISASADLAFEVLYDERQSVLVAGREVDAPGPLGSVCFQALHALRNPWIPAQQRNLDFLIAQTNASDLDKLLEFTRRIGALAAMKPFFIAAYTMPDDFAWPNPSREWLARTTAKTRGSIRVMELIDAPWKDKLQILCRQFNPGARRTLGVSPDHRDRVSAMKLGQTFIEKSISSVREAMEYLNKRGRSTE